LLIVYFILAFVGTLSVYAGFDDRAVILISCSEPSANEIPSIVTDVPSTFDAATVPSIEMLYLSAFSTGDQAKCQAFCNPFAVISVGELSCTVFAL